MTRLHRNTQLAWISTGRSNYNSFYYYYGEFNQLYEIKSEAFQKKKWDKLRSYSLLCMKSYTLFEFSKKPNTLLSLKVFFCKATQHIYISGINWSDSYIFPLNDIQHQYLLRRMSYPVLKVEYPELKENFIAEQRTTNKLLIY